MSTAIVTPNLGVEKAGCAEGGGKIAVPCTVDWREQLFNSCSTGPIDLVSTERLNITSLSGILLDIDPGMFRDSVATPALKSDPPAFYEKVVALWLGRHEVLRSAEVRCSGRGLHAIVWLDKPVEFFSENERNRWAARVRVVQQLLPTDPNCPGITALTRPLGSVNGKNGRPVTCLRDRRPVSVAAVLALCDEVATAPFRTVAKLLFGEEKQISPCLLCLTEGHRLGISDYVGRCYSCGKVKVEDLFNLFLEPEAAAKGGS